MFFFTKFRVFSLAFTILTLFFLVYTVDSYSNSTANVSITDEKQSKLGSGNFKGILVDVIKQGPIEIKINIDGKPITTQKQRFEITFPSQDTTRIHGGNFGESGNKFMQLYKGNANTIIIKDATGSNSIEVIYVTTKSDGTDWKKLDLVNNLTQIVLSINEPGPEDPIEPGPEDPIEPGPEDPIEPGPEDPIEPGPEDPIEPGPEDPV